MESKKPGTASVRFCVAKLRDFVKAVPKGAGEDVNWEELNQHRHLAEMSLTQLGSTFGGREGESTGCEYSFPKL